MVQQQGSPKRRSAVQNATTVESSITQLQDDSSATGALLAVELMYFIWMKMADKYAAIAVQRVFEHRFLFAIKYHLTSTGENTHQMKEFAFGLECSPADYCVRVSQARAAACWLVVSLAKLHISWIATCVCSVSAVDR